MGRVQNTWFPTAWSIELCAKTATRVTYVKGSECLGFPEAGLLIFIPHQLLELLMEWGQNAWFSIVLSTEFWTPTTTRVTVGNAFFLQCGLLGFTQQQLLE